MFRSKDLLLLLVVFSSLFVGVTAPRFSSVFQPFPLYCMMSLLYLAFLSIKVADIWQTLKEMALLILCFLLFRMILLPAALGGVFQIIWPDYALSALLLSGISTGVVAPFISNLVGARTPLLIVVVVMSSTLVPFTLPPLVKVLFGRSMDISLLSMMRTLLLVVFVPLALAEMTRRLGEARLKRLMGLQYPISLVLFAITNLGIFSRYSDFFYRQPQTIVEATLAAVVLGALYFVAGLAVSWGRAVEDQLSAVIGIGIMNNVLVLVFSSQFFGPREPAVAAMYMIPFFGLLLPLRAWRRFRHPPARESLSATSR